MTRQEGVVLSYLEWVRLIGTGAIRLDEGRVVRWRPDRADTLQLVADLMHGAPDLGTSATSFVLVMLEPEVLDQIREDGVYLGQRLKLNAVRSFHSFGETALAVHRHDAKAAGVAIEITSLAAGWVLWAEAVDATDRRARGEALLKIFDLPPSERFSEATEWLAACEQRIKPDDLVRVRDSMFYGWACVLNMLKVSTGSAPILPAEVKDEVNSLRQNFDVDQPFLTSAPRLRVFVDSVAAEDYRLTDLLTMASLKQHERYVIKREGAALDLPSLIDDIRILEELDAGAGGILVQALGERLPGQLIRGLTAEGVNRTLSHSDAATSAVGDAEVEPAPESDVAKVELEPPSIAPNATSDRNEGIGFDAVNEKGARPAANTPGKGGQQSGKGRGKKKLADKGDGDTSKQKTFPFPNEMKN